jgi:hypothetical protein
MNIEMIDLVGSIAGMTAIMIDALAIAGALPLSHRQRLLFGAVAGAWIGLASHLAATGALVFSPDQKVPVVGVLAGAPILIAAGVWVSSAAFRRAILAIPMPLLISLNALRMLGVLFFALLAVGRLSGPFPYSAGLGDILTGVFALPVARMARSGSARSGAAVAWWNLFGAADLIAAVALALTSAQGGPLHFIHVGVGPEAMQYLPFSLVPTVLVPFYLLTHAAVAVQLSANAKPVWQAQTA